MLADVRRGFNLHLGTHRDTAVLRIGPGVVAVPVEAAAHWYFRANVSSGNVTPLQQAPAPDETATTTIPPEGGEPA
jgi:hypothetical protein